MLHDAFGFQHRAGFVERVEGVGCFEKVIGQKVRPEVVQDEGNNLAKLEQFFGEGQLCRCFELDLPGQIRLGSELAEN